MVENEKLGLDTQKILRTDDWLDIEDEEGVENDAKLLNKSLTGGTRHCIKPKFYQISIVSMMAIG